MELIFLIIIVTIVSKAFKQSKELQNNQRRNNPNPWDQVSGNRTGAGYNRPRTSSQNAQWQQAARENIEKGKRRAAEKMRRLEEAFESENRPNTRTMPAYEQMNLQQMQASQMKQENRSAMQQVHAGRVESRNTTILQRAMKNANEDKVDVTLQTMEAEHNHSERVAPAIHHHPEDEIPENMLGTIEDLMVKGYDGNLCFERDFVGEAMDMISRFTVPSDIPDFSKNDVA